MIIENTPVKIGDYISFGKYENAPVLYRVINQKDINNDGVKENMLVSEKALTYKAYDSNGDKGAYVKWYDDNTYKNMLSRGSARWDRSTIRTWLNSEDNIVNYEPFSEKPSAQFVKNNPYDTEIGFMAEGNMSAYERSLIVPATHKSLVSELDFPKDDASISEKNLFGGTMSQTSFMNQSTLFNEYNTLDESLKGYNNSFYNVTKDKVFLLSLEEFSQGNFVDSDKTSHKTAKPTESAKKLNYESDTFLLRDVFDSNNNRHILGEDKVGWYGDANGGKKGIRPALYLSNNLDITGMGTINSPFNIVPKDDNIEITFSNTINVKVKIPSGYKEDTMNIVICEYENQYKVKNVWYSENTVSQTAEFITMNVDAKKANNTFFKVFVLTNNLTPIYNSKSIR